MMIIIVVIIDGEILFIEHEAESANHTLQGIFHLQNVVLSLKEMVLRPIECSHLPKKAPFLSIYVLFCIIFAKSCRKF